MIDSGKLEYYKSLDISDIQIDDLVDIRTVHIDPSRPVLERVLSFIAQIKNPYLFKVGTTPVKVDFNEDGPSLQKCLETFFTKNI